MKKVFALILTLALVATLAVVSFAAEKTTLDADKTYETKDLIIDVTALTENRDAVYSVDVEWTDLTFKYTEGAENAWDPETHEYVIVGAQWTDTEASVKVTNHSNRPVNATVSVSDEEDGYAVTVNDLESDTKLLAAGEIGKPQQAANETFALDLVTDAVPTDGLVAAKVTVAFAEVND